MSFDPVLAHQGGWDEVAILLSPVAVFALLRFLERRRRRGSTSTEGDSTASDVPPERSPDT